MYREMDMGFWLQKAEAELGPPSYNSRTPGNAGSGEGIL